MAISFARQRGITLIEILLVAAIVAAITLGVFALAKKARVAAAVEHERAQLERVVGTIESIFAHQPNFSALGSNGAAYLKDRAPSAGIEFAVATDGTPRLATHLGQGKTTVELRSAKVDFASGVAGRAHNGFVISYAGLPAAECISLIAAAAPRATRVDVGTSSGTGSLTLVADQGRVIPDKSLIAAICKASGVVHLSFAPSRAILAAPSVGSPIPPQCAPTQETRVVSCPAGTTGSITQRRVGSCDGPSNTMTYTDWTLLENSCQADATVPPAEVAIEPAKDCAVVQHIGNTTCPPGQLGSIVRRREVDSCTGSASPWVELANTCQAAPAVVATCVPTTEQRVQPCPAGQGGQQVQERSSSCASPTAAPTWGSWNTISNNCTASCAPTGTCCVPVRETRSMSNQCPAGTYGTSGTQEERFRSCLNATTAGPWTVWTIQSTNATCNACPPSAMDSQAQWVARTRACAAGEVGQISFQAEQTRSRSISYHCPSGTTNQPPPTYGGWTAWTDTGRTRNEVNECRAGPRPPFSDCFCSSNYYDGVGFVSSLGAYPTLESCEAARAGDALTQCRNEISPSPTGSTCYHRVRNSWHFEPRTWFCEHM